MDEFFGDDQCDSYNFELQEREAYDSHKVEFDKKAFHMNERKKIFEKKDKDEKKDVKEEKKEKEPKEEEDIQCTIRKKN